MRFLFTSVLCLFSFSLIAAKKDSKMDALGTKLKRLSPTAITTSTEHLSDGDKKALEKIIEAARHLDGLYLSQVWSGNLSLKSSLEKDTTPSGKEKLQFFLQNAGPWSRLDHDMAFLPGVPKDKPKGAGFYPENMTKEEFDKWANSLSAEDKKSATGFFTVIRRNAEGKLTFKWYSDEYREYLEPASKLLQEAQLLTTNKSLKRFLTARAHAFQSNNYYESDVAWMELDAPLEITIGPYETYEDELFGYKACFEAFIALRNDAETKNLEKYSGQLQDLENALPFDPKYRNPKLGASAPIRVVDQVFSSGEARRGVMTAAFNLPNDEKVIQEKGSKRVMLRNVQLAKFEKVLTPISKVVLNSKDQMEVGFEPFFTHILMHELMHGLGPHNIKKNGVETTVRGELKSEYSAIEEAKADITGLWAMQNLMDKKVIDPKMQRAMYTTFLASAFRSVRFGINEAHGKGIALQFNYLTDEGGFQYDKSSGHFSVNHTKIRAAVEKLTGELLTLQAEGSREKAESLLKKYAHIRKPMESALKKLQNVPVDIAPIYPVAGEK